MVSLERVKASAASAANMKRPRAEGDTCETCGASLAEAHEHLVDPAARALRCACGSCAFVESSRAGAPWKRVPSRAERLDGFVWNDAAWDRLGIPIGLAFFLRSSAAPGVVALYPSPAGAVEAAIDASAWGEVALENPRAGELAVDVEALLVRRVGDRRDHYRVSIDRAYALVGLLRRHWRGLSGGAEAWSAVAAFFDRLERGGAIHA